jgi:hypothetical protein
MAVSAASAAAEAAAYHAALPGWIGQPVLNDDQPTDPAWRTALAAEQEAQAVLARDIFRPVKPLPGSVLGWREGTVIKLARAAYENRLLPSGLLAPERLAVLTDALDEAGSDDAELLAHLRSPGPHVRGCAGIDTILGRN